MPLLHTSLSKLAKLCIFQASTCLNKATDVMAPSARTFLTFLFTIAFVVFLSLTYKPMPRCDACITKTQEKRVIIFWFKTFHKFLNCSFVKNKVELNFSLFDNKSRSMLWFQCWVAFERKVVLDVIRVALIKFLFDQIIHDVVQYGRKLHQVTLNLNQRSTAL